MAAPSYVQAGTGITDISGAWSMTGPTAGAAGNLVMLVQYVDGTTGGVAVSTTTNLVDLAGNTDELDGFVCDVGSPAVGRLYVGLGRVVTGGATYAVTGDTGTSDDVFARFFEFQDVVTTSGDVRVVVEQHNHPPIYFGSATAALGANGTAIETDGTYFIAISEVEKMVVADNVLFAGYTNIDPPGTLTTLYGLATDGAGTWVAAGGGTGPSNDLIYCTGDPSNVSNWTTNDQGSQIWRDVAYGNGYWVGVGDNGTLYYATDPTGSWTSNTQGSSQFLGVAYGNGYWVAVGASGTLYYKATDPTGSWTSNTQGSTTFQRVRYGGGNWVAVGDSGTVRYKATNPTGAWTSNAQGTNQFRGIYYGGPNGDLWVACGAGGVVRYTTDPSTASWTVSAAASPGSITYTDMIWADGYWAATWYLGANSTDVIVSFPITREIGTNATIPDASVVTGSADRLAINVIAISDDNAISAFSGQSGGTWSEPIAEYASSTGNDGAIGIQIATMSSAGTIDGGTFTQADGTDGFGVLGFALIGTTTAGGTEDPMPYIGAGYYPTQG